jgi:hypothetical protein
MGQKSNAYQGLVRKHERYYCEYLQVDGEIILKTDVKETGWECMDWINLDQDHWLALV